MELVPAIAIFFILLTAGLAYFRVMRAATIRQEVVRNIAFAKINNSGTLTTPPNQLAGADVDDLSLSTEIRGSTVTVVKKSANTFISENNNCFAAFPSESIAAVALGTLPVVGALGAIQFSTYAVVYRKPNGSCP